MRRSRRVAQVDLLDGEARQINTIPGLSGKRGNFLFGPTCPALIRADRIGPRPGGSGTRATPWFARIALRAAGHGLNIITGIGFDLRLCTEVRI